MLNRRNFLGAMGAAGAALPNLTSCGSGTPESARQPNFLVILADDMGFSDAGCYGGDIDTPNLDRLASNGLRFTQAYSTARCGPSRSCLLTGHYAQQTASDVMTRGNVPDYTQFIPDYLKPLGYRSYHSGKWHMDFVTGEGGVGFDHSYTERDENRYFTPNRLLLDGEQIPSPTIEDNYFLTTAIADHAVGFLQEHARDYADDPFFTFLAFHAPHFPLHALPEDIERYKDRFTEGWDVARERKWQRMRDMGLVNCDLAPLEPDMWTRWNTPDEELLAQIGPGEVSKAVPWASLTQEQKDFQRTKMAIHAAMVTRVDIEIGKVFQQLEAMGTAEDTVILFLSDNGCSSEQLIRGDGHDPSVPPGSAYSYLGLGPGWSSCSNTPFRLHKSWVNEGGIASPLIVHWPNGIEARNELRHNQSHFVDVLPTLVDLAGGSTATDPATGAPPIAGRSLAPAFETDGAATRDFLYFNHSNNRAIRVEDWKLIATGTEGPWELYDMSTDRCEQVNLAAEDPDVALELADLWQEQDDAYALQRESAEPTTKQRI